MNHPPDSDEVVARALVAFWQVVTSSYPSALTGSLSVRRTVGLRRVASAAVTEWIAHSVPPRDA